MTRKPQARQPDSHGHGHGHRDRHGRTDTQRDRRSNGNADCGRLTHCAGAERGADALKVGQWREGINVRTRVVEFFQPTNAPEPSYLAGDSDGDGAIARVEMCVRADGKPAKGEIYDLFMAYDASGGQYTRSSSSWGEWPPLPQLPIDISIAPGKCLSGRVLLSAPKNTKLVTVDMSDGEGGSIAEWKAG